MSPNRADFSSLGDVGLVAIPPAAEAASRAVVAAISERLHEPDPPLLVAIDGPSGSGKSLIAARVAELVSAAVVPSDDFFAADIPDSGWDSRSPSERARDCIDWRLLRSQVLEPLSQGRTAAWRAFDFAAGPRSDGTYPLRGEATELHPRPVIILDGAYSSRSELSDLLDLTVLVQAGPEERARRLALREDPDFLRQWHARWDDAESYYFGTVRGPSTFDLVVQNG